MRRVLLAPLLLLMLASPVAADSHSPQPTPIPAPDPACPTGFPPGSTSQDDGDSCFYISGEVLGTDGLPVIGATVSAKVVPAGGDTPAVGTYASTTGEDGVFRLGVLPGYRWRVLVRPAPDAEPVLIPLSTGTTQSEDAVFSISTEGRIIMAILIGGDGVVRGEYNTAVLQVLTPTPPPAQYNPLDYGIKRGVELQYEEEFLNRLAAVEAAQRSADPITLLNLFLGTLLVGSLGLFAWRLNSAPHTVAASLGKRRRRKRGGNDEQQVGDDLFD